MEPAAALLFCEVLMGDPIFVNFDETQEIRVDVSDLEDLAKSIAEADRMAQRESLESRVKTVRENWKEQRARAVLTGTDGTDFEGFCSRCDGFRKHKRGCPPQEVKLDPSWFLGGP